MNVSDALDFISYCAFRCNGSTLIAQIHQTIMANRVKYNTIFKNECHKCWYLFLLKVNKDVMPDVCPGSCTDPRFTFSGGSNNTMWHLHRKDLLSVIKQFYTDPLTCKRQKSLKEVIDRVLNRLANGKKNNKIEFCGVGSMGSNQFLHLSSLLGLIPLYCFNHANVMDVELGPGVLIRRCLGKPNMKLKEVQDYFQSVVCDLKTIWSDLVTPSLIENTLCEVMRCVNSTEDFVNSIRSKTRKKAKKINPTIIMNDNLRRESRSQDIYYFDESTKRVQNVFHVTSACSGGSSIRPCLLLKDSMSWSDKKTNSVHNITNWCQNRDDKKMVHWEHKGCDLNLKSRFICSASMKKLMSVPNT